MTTSRIATIALTLSLAVSGIAQAETGLTREQVKAELAQAQRAGELVDYETGLKQNQLFPSAYPRVPHQVRSITRTERKADTTYQATGSIEFDAIAQRNAEALARRPLSVEDGHFAGNNR